MNYATYFCNCIIIIVLNCMTFAVNPTLLQIYTGMEPPVFRIVNAPDNKVQFIEDKIVITVDRFEHDENKHRITSPERATAQLQCPGRLYLVTNANRIPTVEDWYQQELLLLRYQCMFYHICRGRGVISPGNPLVVILPRKHATWLYDQRHNGCVATCSGSGCR